MDEGGEVVACLVYKFPKSSMGSLVDDSERFFYGDLERLEFSALPLQGS